MWGKPRWRRRRGRLQRWTHSMLFAELRVLAYADVLPLQELVREEALVVRLRDPDDRQRVRWLRMRAVRPCAVRLRLLALEEVDRGLSCRVRLSRHVLVDGAGLPAGDDVLHALHGRVLAAQRERLQALRLQIGDDRAGDVVVRREHAVDLVARLDQHLAEDGRRVVRVPVGHEPLRASLDRAALEERVEYG